MENNQIYIENIGIGLQNISNLYNLDLNLNEYLVVGQRNNANPSSSIDYEYNMIVNNNGVGINASRRDMRDTNAGLLVNNNIVCRGKLIANSVEFQNFSLNSNVTNDNLINLINRVNSNLYFFNGYTNQQLVKTIYCPNYLSIGNYLSTYQNSHPFKISDSPNGKSSNVQFAIYNQANNDIEDSKFTFGMLGFQANTPANIITTAGMPLEFHISKNSSKIDEIYSNNTGLPNYTNNSNNYPQLSIDVNGTVNINKNICDISIINNNNQITPKLYVNGGIYGTDIYMQDSLSKSNLHLRDIFIAKTGLTLNLNQIYGGEFTKAEFKFTSNVYIGNDNNSNNCNFTLNVNDTIIVKRNLTTDNLNANNTIINGRAEFNRISYFNNTAIFNEDLSINKSLNIGNDLFINGYRVNFSNINNTSNGLNYDNQCNLNISGRFGTGIFPTDNYDHQFNIIKRRPERFEIYMNDISNFTTDSSKVFIGHTNLKKLNGTLDNSLIFLTQKNIRWHNIYFYAGKDRDGLNGFKTITPTFAIMENNKIGINTNIPNKTLDIIGDMVCNDYYIRNNNIDYKLNIIYTNNSGSSILKVNNLDINLIDNQVYNNKKTLNLNGGINSYDGYFQGNFKLSSFINYDNYKITSINSNIGIGVTRTDNLNPLPLQIRNTNITANNNTIIRLYRGIRGGGLINDSPYTGIDFCDYDMKYPFDNRNDFKWFIYKNHTNPNTTAGVLQIGYTKGTTEPTDSGMNFYYDETVNKYFIDINNPRVDYTYNRDTAVSIKGNVEINGNLNLIGENSSYKINGIIVGSFSNPIIMSGANKISYNNFERSTKNDLSLVGNKIGLLPDKTIAFGFNKDDWIYKKLNYIEGTIVEDNALSIFYNNKDYINDSIPPIVSKFYNKSFNNYNLRPDISIIQQGIIDDKNPDSGNIMNRVDLKLKGYTSDLTIYEITPNNATPFITFINKGNKNQVNIGNKGFYLGNAIIYPSTAVHINDDYDCLLKLTNFSKPVKIELTNDTNMWTLTTDTKFDLTFNKNSILNLNSNGQTIINNYNFINNSNYLYDSTVNLNSVPNKPVVECTNFYYNDFKNNSDITNGRNTFIQSHYSNIQAIVTNNYIDSYDDTKDVSISKFIYTVNDSNLPLVDINNNHLLNYGIVNSNKVFNSNINLNFTLNPKNVMLDYKYLDNIIINEADKKVSLIPSLYSYDKNVTVNIKTTKEVNVSYTIEDFNLNLTYILPRTTDIDGLTIDSIINHFEKTSVDTNNNFYNLNLRTILNVKNNNNINNYLTKQTSNLFTVQNNSKTNIISTINNIYYYPYIDVSIDEVEIKLNYIYNYFNDINVPKNFFNNYNNSISINSIQTSNAIINNSNTFLTTEIKGDLLSELSVYVYPTNIICSNLSTDVIQKLYPIEINNNPFMTIPLTITKNNYFDYYNFPDNYSYIPLPIIVNNYNPHMILKNYINSKYSAPHKIYSYDDKYEIHLGNSKLLSLDSNGNLNAKGAMNISDLYLSGDIYSTSGCNITSVYSNLTNSNFYLTKTNISLNSSNLFFNPSIINNGGVIINRGDIYSSNNLFEINNYIDNDNFITLKSVSDSSIINFFGNKNFYKLGSSNGNFGIWRTTDSSILASTYVMNNFNNFSNVISFDYSTGNNPIIYLNGAIKSTNNLSINDMYIYPNNDLNYKVRVNGNMKVDGIVMSLSDIRIKSEIKKIENALDKISKLNGVTFINNATSKNRETGLIAQEVKEILPEAVYEDEKGYLNIAYGNLMGLVIEAIKEIKLLIK